MECFWHTLCIVTQTVLCSHCGSPRLTRDGKAPNGKQKYLCHECGKRSRHAPGTRAPSTRAYPEGFRAQVLAAYHERCSQRGVCRICGISRETLAAWLKNSRGAAALAGAPGPGLAR